MKVFVPSLLSPPEILSLKSNKIPYTPTSKRLHQSSMFHRPQCIMVVKFMAAFLQLLVLTQEQMYIFYDLVFSWSAFSEKSDLHIYL